MKSYLSFFKLRFSVGLQYRFAAIAGILTQIFWGFMLIMIYEAYYRAGIETPMAWSELVSYVWIGQALFTFTYLGYKDKDIIESLVNGQVSYELVRPSNLYWFWYIKLAAGKLAGAVLRFVPMIIFAFLIPGEYGLKLPPTFTAFILFFITLMLGFVLSIAILMIVYILLFYTVSSRGLFNIATVITDFFAGGTVPIPFMPVALQTLCYALPFRLIMDLPYRIYVGNIGTMEALQSIVVQVIWIAITMLAGTLFINKATRRVEVQGG